MIQWNFWMSRKQKSYNLRFNMSDRSGIHRLQYNTAASNELRRLEIFSKSWLSLELIGWVKRISSEPLKWVSLLSETESGGPHFRHMHNKHSNNVGSVRHLESELGTSKILCPLLAPLATVSDSGRQRITSFLLSTSAKAFPSCNKSNHFGFS